jgi:hypothetical protein
LRKTTKLKQSTKAISRVIIVLLMVAIALAASVSTYALTSSNLNTDNQQTGNPIQTYPVQSNLVIAVQNPRQQQVHLQQNGSVYIDNIVKNILKCNGKDVALGELIPLGANQTVELTVDYQSKPNEQLNIKIITVEGGDLVTVTQTTTYSIKYIPLAMPTPVATVVFTSGNGGAVDPSGIISDLVVGITYPITAFANDGYFFSSWTYTGSIDISNTASASTTMRINGPGTATVTGNFVPAPDPRVVFASGGSQSIYADLVSSPLVIQRLDNQNRPITTGTTTINLASTSSGSFYSNAAATNRVTSVTIPNDSSAAIVWYKDSSAGTPTLTASSSGYSSVSTTFTIKSLSGLSVWDQTGGTAPWTLTILGGGNSGDLTVVSPGYNDSYAAQLTCTAFPSPEGAVAQQYWFDTLSVGQTYTCTFYYKSNVDFQAYFFSATENWTSVYATGVDCGATSTWKSMSFQIDPIQPATYYWLSFNLYSVGQLQVDNVCFGATD